MSKKTLALLLLLGVSLMGIILFIVLANMNVSGKPRQAQPTPTIPLTTEQKQLPTAKPQTFDENAQKTTGAVIITSFPSGARVIIDAPKEEASGRTTRFPINETPFRLDSLPAGSYGLFASKEGYEISEKIFTITPGNVTTVTIQLTPLDKSQY